MNLSGPAKLSLWFLLAFVAGVLYLRLGQHLGWGRSLLVGLITAPVVVGAWKFRDWYTDRARRAGLRWRERRLARRRAR
ncbi:hypothetical protein [Streptomyces sp. NPDC088923]|uniref:hypothetical protein n=1 Tax=Streptomyces sp. NPDC088923 TaxID=3365913 RepID=UPI003817B3A2